MHILIANFENHIIDRLCKKIDDSRCYGIQMFVVISPRLKADFGMVSHDVPGASTFNHTHIY